MTARKTQRQKDQELIAELGSSWANDTDCIFPDWDKHYALYGDDEDAGCACLQAAARELNRISREHRARGAK